MFWELDNYEERTALIQNGRIISYEELQHAAREIASYAKPDSLAFIICTNSFGSLAGYIGFLSCHIVPVMIDVKIDKEFLHYLQKTYHPAWIWKPVDYNDVISGAEPVFEKEGYILLRTDDPISYPIHKDLALLITTSGSTGSPKLVRQTYENLESNTKSIIEYLEIGPNDRAITALPMHYVYGLSVVNTHLATGATLILTDVNCYTKQFWDLFDAYGATSFSGVPFMYEMIDKLRILQKRTLPSLKTMTQAGGKLLPALQKKFSEYAAAKGKKFVVMYGASEATARMGYLPTEKALEKEGSIGIPIPGGRFELIDEMGKTIEEDGKIGELVYYGKNVTMGYANRGEDLSKEDENNGRLLTGDMATRDEDGFYYIVGRKKRFIKILGKRVNLDEVERILKNECGTMDIACGGQDDLLKVFVIDATIRERVGRFVFERIGINQRMTQVKVINEIPKNSSGKILYSVLNEME